jgi:tetratricopeptide (TPR) repeat protein
MVGLSGCAGTSKPPKTGPAAVPKPRREVSADAKTAFDEAVKAYQAAPKGSGGLDVTQCASIAAEFADVYDDHPKLPEAKFNEGAVYQECGQVAKAEAIYRQLVQQHPNFGPALNNLGQIAMGRGQQGVAMDYFQRAARAKDSSAYANLAVAQRQRALGGDRAAFKEAVDNIHRALAVDSFNVDAYGILATLVYDHAKSKSRLEIARLICVQAMKRFPDYAPVYNVLGLILLRMDEVTRALAQFRKAVALDPEFIEAHMNIGAITLSFRDYRTAEASFSKVLSLKADAKTKVEATVGLGVAYRGQRRFDEAMQQYKKAQAMDAGNADVAYNMGILLQDYLFDASNPARGIEQLRQARALLERFSASATRARQAKDARRRIKNIDEMLPILQEQQRMMPQG